MLTLHHTLQPCTVIRMTHTLNQRQAAGELGVHLNTVRRMIAQGKLTTIELPTRTGRTVTRIPAEQIQKLKAEAVA